MKRQDVIGNVPPKKRMFTGEPMTCCMCGKTQQSDPKIESNWTYIEVDGVGYYVCPDELPLNQKTATKWDFERAYTRILKHIMGDAK